MNKVININFQGRVIPIEETAYEMLKQYIESLRRYFAQEEGKDEIINDIENRIAELFDDNLKKGAVCITDVHVSTVMASMGRPEDFEEQDANYSNTSSSGKYSSATSNPSAGASTAATEEPRRLTRAENDKVLGGVCAGVAHYFKIDPAVARIIFALIAFGGFGFGILLYIVLWIILPARELQSNVRKRLYRDQDNKMVGGVASGLSAYFNIDTWIPRVVFLLPFLLSFVPNIFNRGWGHWGGPWVAFSGLGGTFFVTYIILWIVLPKAVTASEKLEMRGEKIDLESIKNTVQEELQGVKGRAQKAGATFSEKAVTVGEEISKVAQEKSQAFAAEVKPMARKAGTGIGEAIGVLFKVFFLGIAGIVAFALMAVLIALLYSGVGVFPLKNFLLEGFWENFLAWSVLALFIGVPIIAIIVWIVRRIMGAKSKSPYLGYAFGSLWIIGLISVITLASMVARDFRYASDAGEASQYAEISQPSNGSMVVKVSGYKKKYYAYDFFDGELPFLSYNGDSMLLNTVRIKLVKSKDSLYHINMARFARGKSPEIAERNASNVKLDFQQVDSIVTLASGFPVSQNHKFRNQQVLVIVEVPVGKKIMIDKSVNNYDWFNINVHRRRGLNIDSDDNWEDSYSWNSNVRYVMTHDGLERIDKEKQENTKLKNGKFKLKADENGVEIEAEGEVEDDNGSYRYKKQGDSIKIELKNPPAAPKAPAAPARNNAPVTSIDREIETEAAPVTERKIKRFAKGEPDSDLHSPFAFLTGR